MVAPQTVVFSSANSAQYRDGLVAIFTHYIQMRDGAHLPVVNRV